MKPRCILEKKGKKTSLNLLSEKFLEANKDTVQLGIMQVFFLVLSF
jgi:hypothetical protein